MASGVPADQSATVPVNAAGSHRILKVQSPRDRFYSGNPVREPEQQRVMQIGTVSYLEGAQFRAGKGEFGKECLVTLCRVLATAYL